MTPSPAPPLDGVVFSRPGSPARGDRYARMFDPNDAELLFRWVVHGYRASRCLKPLLAVSIKAPAALLSAAERLPFSLCVQIATLLPPSPSGEPIRWPGYA